MSSNGVGTNVFEAIKFLAMYGQKTTVKALPNFLPDSVPANIRLALENAAAFDHIDTLNYILSISPPGDVISNHHLALQIAAEHEYTNTVESLVGKNCSVDIIKTVLQLVA